LSNFFRADDLLIIDMLATRSSRRPIPILIRGQVIIVVHRMAASDLPALFLNVPVANLLVLHVTLIDEDLDNEVLKDKQKKIHT
jgi:hypothetical protein